MTASPLGIPRASPDPIIDFDSDGWPILFVANDTRQICRNNRDGTFADVGLRSGVAYSGRHRAGAMGVDAPTDRSGRHLLVGNFSNQMLGLYHNEGNGLLVDEARDPRWVARRCFASPSACVLLDYDLDGR